jgi:Zn-dependent peptidase ImmA (M78 family)
MGEAPWNFYSGRPYHKKATFQKDRKRLFIFYDSWQPHYAQVLSIAHEFGHFLLGHHNHTELYSWEDSLFCTYGPEKDASIIAFLCLIPTPFLEKMEFQGRLNPEELFWELWPGGRNRRTVALGDSLCKTKNL